MLSVIVLLTMASPVPEPQFIGGVVGIGIGRPFHRGYGRGGYYGPRPYYGGGGGYYPYPSYGYGNEYGRYY